MCGIFGFFGKPDSLTPTAIDYLAIMNESRGRDSSGLAVITPDTYSLYKKATPSTNIINHRGYQKVRKEVAGRVIVIGHTRLATRGKIKNTNSHPFRVGSTVFAHNGMIWNFNSLQRKYRTSYEVDSQILGYLVNRSEALLSKAWGSYALPYVDLSRPEVFKIALDGSPCSIASKGEQMYYSSEHAHLKGLFPDYKVERLRDGFIYTFTQNQRYRKRMRGYLKRGYLNWRGYFEKYA